MSKEIERKRLEDDLVIVVTELESGECIASLRFERFHPITLVQRSGPTPYDAKAALERGIKTLAERVTS